MGLDMADSALAAPLHRYRTRLSRREVFGWLKTVGLMRRAGIAGCAGVDWLFTFAAAVSCASAISCVKPHDRSIRTLPRDPGTAREDQNGRNPDARPAVIDHRNLLTPMKFFVHRGFSAAWLESQVEGRSSELPTMPPAFLDFFPACARMGCRWSLRLQGLALWPS
jgi:hypothetical protein